MDGRAGVRPPAADGAEAGAGSLLWLIGIRLVVITTLLVGALIIQVTTRMILPLTGLYLLVLVSYALSLGYVVVYARGLRYSAQVVVQLLGDMAVVTGFVYVTGGLYSPFSFLYLTVIVLAAVYLRGGGLIFAGLSAVAYGLMADLIAFGVVPAPQSLMGPGVAMPPSRVLSQLLAHIVGFVLIAVLVSLLGESLRTARHSLREEQRRAQQLAALTDHVVRSVTAGIIAVGPDGTVLQLNPAGAQILGISSPEMATGRRIDDVMPVRELDWGLLMARAAQGRQVRREAHLADSETQLGFTVGPLTDDQGGQVGLVINFQDLSELERKIEEERLQERMAAVGELAARVAHEIKNPLASISGSAQMLASHQGADPTVRRLLGIVVDESRRLSTILDGFLEYTRPRQSTMKTCDLVPLLADCLELLRGSEETAAGHTLELETPDRLQVVGDEHQLKQVFWNLSRNALEAMPNGGVLRVSARLEMNHAVLSWADSGVGMNEEMRLRAFEPFVTGHARGTGLGLAVVYTVIDEHGGSVEIDSTPGSGTTVTVTLPCRRELR